MPNINTRIKHKRDTSSNWTTNNPVLLDGELIIVDTKDGDTRFKIGDGVKTYTQLPFQDESLYSVLSGKVSPEDLGDGTITITQNGSTKGTFTTNQKGSINIQLDDTYTKEEIDVLVGDVDCGGFEDTTTSSSLDCGTF